MTIDSKTIILKNTTGSEITVRGRPISAAGQRDFSDLSPVKFNGLSALVTQIDAGDIVVNDGTSDLSATAGHEHIVDRLYPAFQIFYSDTDGINTAAPLGADATVLRSSGAASAPVWSTIRTIFTDEAIVLNDLTDVNTTPTDGQVLTFNNTSGNWEASSSSGAHSIEKDDVTVVAATTVVNFEGPVSVVDEGSGKATVSVGGTTGILGCSHQMTFLDQSSDVREQWLGYYEEGIPSSDTQGIMPWKSKLIGITFSNKNTGVDQTVKIYSTPEGGGTSPKTLDFSWVLSNIRMACKSNFASDIIFDAGDKIGIFLDDNGTNANRPVVKLYFKVIEDVVGECSENHTGSFATGGGGGSS